jgi:hypothetical protein
MNRVLSLALVGLVLVSGGLAQTQITSPPIRSEEDLDKFLAGGTLQECQVHFHECSHDLSEWVKWGNENYPIGQQLYAQNVKLTADNKKLRAGLNSNYMWVFLGFCGFGAGLGVVLLSIRFLRRKWRASPMGKQLTVLVLGAVWITVVALVSLNIPRLSVHPVNLAFTVGVYSIPAILFSGIAFWWFAKAKQELH